MNSNGVFTSHPDNCSGKRVLKKPYSNSVFMPRLTALTFRKAMIGRLSSGEWYNAHGLLRSDVPG